MRTSVALALFLLVSSVAHAQGGDESSASEVGNGVFIQGQFIKGQPYEITPGKKLLNTIRLVFAQDELKKSWPYFGYKFNKIKDNFCNEGYASRNLSAGKKIAFVRASFDGSNHGSGSDQKLDYDLDGVKLEFDQNIGGNDISIRHVCDWIRDPTEHLKPDIVAKIRALEIISCKFLKSGKWSIHRDGLPDHAISMMSGQLTTDISSDSYTLLPNEVLKDENAGSRKIAWKIKQDDGGSSPTSGGHAITWKYTPPPSGADAFRGIEYYLTYPGNPQNSGVQTVLVTTTWRCPNSSLSEWAENFSGDDVADNLFSMWYGSSSDASQAVSAMDDEWYLLIDGLLPTAKADIRIERGVLE